MTSAPNHQIRVPIDPRPPRNVQFCKMYAKAVYVEGDLYFPVIDCIGMKDSLPDFFRPQYSPRIHAVIRGVKKSTSMPNPRNPPFLGSKSDSTRCQLLRI